MGVSTWAEQEMASVDLGDERLDRRAAAVLTAMGNHPSLSIPAACGGHAEIQAAYRFFDNAKVSFEGVLAGHRQRTLERMASQAVVLLVQDSSEIELTRPQQQIAGVGELDGARRGVLLHLMEAFTPDGTPLGALWGQVLNRTGGVSHALAAAKQRRCKHTPIEQKESLRWLTGLREARQAAEQLAQVHCICIADSEADIYECLAEDRGTGRLDWLVRACQDRAVQEASEGTGEHLREAAMAGEVLYELELVIRQREAKTTAEDRPRRQSRSGRVARVQVRSAKVSLRPPWRMDRKLPAITVNVVLVREVRPPKGQAAVEWVLLTTLPIDTIEAVRQVVEYYCVRWGIEIVFRVLKSGCRIEHRRFEDVDRVLPCLGLCLIVAWRTLFVCRLGRECPQMDCQTVFEPSEWKAVWTAVHRRNPPRKRPGLGQMVHLVARLGGYVQRPRSEPGPQTVWIGLQRMYDLAWAWEAFGPETRIPMR